MSKIRIGIFGGAGYTAGELIRLLLNHPNAEVAFVASESNAGNLLTDVHEGLYGDTMLRFCPDIPMDEVDVVFLCFGHGKSESFLREHNVPQGVRIIDLAQDFRLMHEGNPFVYGLPELHHEAIAKATRVANPGCFATCIQLGLLPAAQLGILHGSISVNAITGSTGAGQKPGPTTHFSWRTDNMSIYKPFQHQHVPEICQSLKEVQGDMNAQVDFIPYRGNFARGIFATEVVHTDAHINDIVAAYKAFYHDAPFTHYVDKAIDLKQVINTNKCLVHCEKYDDKLLVTACIDNLLKGAVGQAVQNMNIMMGHDETAGLRLKPSAF